MSIFATVQRKFLGNLFLLQALNWLVKPLWIFWIDRLAQVQLGDTWYGKYYVVFSFALLFNILLDFGLNNYISSRVARGESREVIVPVLKWRLMLAAFYTLLVLALGWWQNFSPAMLLLVVVNQVLAGFTLFFRSILQGRHAFRTDSIVSVTDRIIAILICGIFLYSSGFVAEKGVIVFLSAQTAGYAVTLMLAAYFALTGLPKGQSSKEPESGLQWLQKTAWFAALAFAMSVFTRIDALMIRNLAPGGYSDAGLYAQSFRLLDAALIFSTLISTMLLPIFSRMLANGESTSSLIWLNLRIVLFVAVPAALVAAFYGADIMQLLYGKSEDYANKLQASAAIFMPLMACFIPMALVHIFGTWLTANNKLRFLSFLAISCVVLNIGINALVIADYGALGAAWACLVTQMVFALGCIFQVKKQNGFSFENAQWMRLFLWLTLSFLTFFLWEVFFTGILAACMACLVFLLVTVLSGIFHPELKKIPGFQTK